MSYLINRQEVLNLLHNQMGHRIPPGGTDDDLKRYIQEAFKYAWRYYKWGWAMKRFTTLDDGVLPEDFDLEGYFDQSETYTPTWDSTTGRLILDPVAAVDIVYQMAPPELGDDADGSAPFPSALTIAEGALIFAKLGENPTRADIQPEWDMFHSLLDRHVGFAERNKTRTPQNRHSVTGTNTGQV